MQINKIKIYTTTFLLAAYSILCLTGCDSSSKDEKPKQDLSGAHIKFVDICEKEFKYDVIPRKFDNAFWIYLPFDDNILNFQSTADGPKNSKDSSQQLSVLYNGTEFDEGTFNVNYDIRKTTKYKIEYGYTNVFSQEATTIIRNLYQAISRAYFDVEELPGEKDDVFVERVPGDLKYKYHDKDVSHTKLVHSYVKTQRMPEFFVIIIADIEIGMAYKAIFYFPDFKRAMSNPLSLPFEEFMLRSPNEIFGLENLIGDKYGKSLEMGDIEWSDFLSRQIETRIKFKYQQSDFKPSENTVNEIFKITATALNTYKFETYHTVSINDLYKKTTVKFDKSQVLEYKEE